MEKKAQLLQEQGNRDQRQVQLLVMLVVRIIIHLWNACTRNLIEIYVRPKEDKIKERKFVKKSVRFWYFLLFLVIIDHYLVEMLDRVWQ